MPIRRRSAGASASIGGRGAMWRVLTIALARYPSCVHVTFPGEPLDAWRQGPGVPYLRQQRLAVRRCMRILFPLFPFSTNTHTHSHRVVSSVSCSSWYSVCHSTRHARSRDCRGDAHTHCLFLTPSIIQRATPQPLFPGGKQPTTGRGWMPI